MPRPLYTELEKRLGDADTDCNLAREGLNASVNGEVEWAVKCSECGARANVRLWKQGKERWFYETIKRGHGWVKRWTCLRCTELPEAGQ